MNGRIESTNWDVKQLACELIGIVVFCGILAKNNDGLFIINVSNNLDHEVV